LKKIIAYGVRSDESDYFEKYKRELSIEVKCVPEDLSLTNVKLAQGYTGISVAGKNVVSADVIKELSSLNIKFLSVRSIGYNNVDQTALKEHTIRLSNVSYSPNSVAEYAVLLMLLSLRNTKSMLRRNEAQDYTLAGLQGKQLQNLTVGIIGTGKIGETVAKILTGFGCKMIAYDLYPKENLKDILTYVPFDELIANSDVITIHTPLFKENYHMINTEEIKKMRDGVCLINSARGELINTEALISGIEEGKIGSVGLDVLEGELTTFHNDRRTDILANRDLAVLRSFPNVIVTPHASFYTNQAVSDMVENSVRSLKDFIDSNQSPREIQL
jgi:lactate dehydrogenase-like 2-hydroxyacid dehydrogenase